MRKLSNEEIKKKTNQIGAKALDRFIFISSKRGKYGQILVKIQNLKTEQIISINFSKISKNKNLFSRIQDFKAKKIVEEIGKQSIPQFSYVSMRRNEKSKILIKIKNATTGKTIEAFFDNIKNRKNPFIQNKLSKKEVIEKINKLGKLANPKFKFISTQFIKNRRFVKICCENGSVKFSRFDHLMKGQNPFSKIQNRIELNKIHPIYENLFKKLKIPYIKEFKLGRKRIDFVIFPNTKKIGIEVKQSEKLYMRNNQISTYRKISKLNQYRLSKIILSDPRGIHKGSLSIKELEDKILK